MTVALIGYNYTYTGALKGLPYHNFGVDVYTAKLLGA